MPTIFQAFGKSQSCWWRVLPNVDGCWRIRVVVLKVGVATAISSFLPACLPFFLPSFFLSFFSFFFLIIFMFIFKRDRQRASREGAEGEGSSYWVFISSRLLPCSSVPVFFFSYFPFSLFKVYNVAKGWAPEPNHLGSNSSPTIPWVGYVG